jgi:V8-like Glu-specific endopeptidase
VLLQQQLAQIRPQVRDSILEVVNQGNAQVPSGNVTGPPFTWRGGDFPETEYQALFQKGRPLISSAWINDVTSRLSPAVCLIKIAAIGREATGFLIGKDLVLTNYHVVNFTPQDDMSANLSNMELYFTESKIPDRVFKLASAVNGTTPLVAQSAQTSRDYVLLRVSEDVSQVLSVQPFVCDGVTRPVRGQSINILQHPNGEPSLQISFEKNGVSNVYPDASTVQYISITQDGSSGSPCIDDDKRLVAIHHAAKETPFGSIREGILMSAIFSEIAAFL